MKKAIHSFPGSEKISAKSPHKPVGLAPSHHRSASHLPHTAHLSRLSGHGMTRPQRQASVLQMQAQMGNAFVQRWLNGGPQTTTIQRQCPCQEKDESEGECPTCSQQKVQRRSADAIQREEGPGEASYEYDWNRSERINELKTAIENETETSLQTRASLESMTEASSEERTELETGLNKAV
ncbi:MAG: hypothetical protein IPL78_04490 [Chloroflexi bacterium]|nr:hypothetical protein [Chloroflexota bacterium]